METKFIRVEDFIFNIDNIICICKEEMGDDIHYIAVLLKDDETRYIKYEYKCDRDDDFERIESILGAKIL